MLHVGYLEILETPYIESISNQVKNVSAPLASSLGAVPARHAPLRRAQFILAPPRPGPPRPAPRSLAPPGLCTATLCRAM